MPAAQRQRQASEGSPLFHRRLARCVVLAGGTIAAWLLASGIASATDAMGVQDPHPSGSSLLSDHGGLLFGSGASSGARGVANRVTSDVASAVPPVLADQRALPELDRLPAPADARAAHPTPVAFPFELGLPGGLALPGQHGRGTPPVSGPPTRHAPPIIPPSGDAPYAGQAVATLPAVAADVFPGSVARTSSAPTDLTPGTRPASAATPEHHDEGAPTGGLPCPPPPASPTPATGVPATAMSAVVTAPSGASARGWTHARAPRHGPIATSSIADRPGSTPD